MSRRSRWPLAAAIALLLAWMATRETGETPPPLPQATPTATPTPFPAARQTASAERPALLPPARSDLATIPPHPDAVSFGEGHLDPAAELAQVHVFFEHYRLIFGAFPAGQDNAQFMNALRGNNPRGLGIFPFSHPRLDDRGRLLDAWGQAFIFHPISRDHLEIRSAGPDREAYTADDLLVPLRTARP